MEESDHKEEILEPLPLDPASPSKEPVSRSRGLWGGVLLVGLLLWSLLLVVMFQPEPPEEPPAEVGELPEGGAPQPEIALEATPLAPATPEPVAPSEKLTITTRPAGASVLRDGRFLGTTPLELSDWQQDDAIQIRKAGFLPVESTLPAPAASAELMIDLRAESAPIRLSGNLEGAVIRVDGKTVTPEAGGLLTLPLTETLIRVEKAGFEPWERRITPARSYRREVQVTFTPLEQTQVKTTDAPPAPNLQKVSKNSLGIEMILPSLLVEAEIGAPRGTPGRKSHEGLRRIRLERAFRISSTEISNAQFARFDPSHSSGKMGSVNLAAQDLPVVNVTWEQAVQFCNWLSGQEGLPPAYVKTDGGRWAFDPEPGTGYRLPTEAEWEGVVRRHAGSGRYAWGDDLPPPEGVINLAGEESKRRVRTVLSGFRDPWVGPAPVGEAPEGPEGLRGFAGNVKEWMHDGFSVPQSSTSVEVDPMVDCAARFHVIKGASWQDGSWMDFALARRRYDDQAAPDLGFRVARYVE